MKQASTIQVNSIVRVLPLEKREKGLCATGSLLCAARENGATISLVSETLTLNLQVNYAQSVPWIISESVDPMPFRAR
jgi:hypothetical protein